MQIEFKLPMFKKNPKLISTHMIKKTPPPVIPPLLFGKHPSL